MSWVNLYQSPAEHFFAGSHQLFMPSDSIQISAAGTPTGIKVIVAGPQMGLLGLSIAGNAAFILDSEPGEWIASGFRYLVVGTNPGASDIVNAGVLPGSQLSYKLPMMTIGTLDATVSTELGGHWTAYQSITFYVEPPVATFTYPLPGLLNVDATRPITWMTNSQDQGHYLVVGTTPGSADLINSGVLPMARQYFSGVPLPKGVPLYATIFTEVAGSWARHQSITFTAG